MHNSNSNSVLQSWFVSVDILSNDHYAHKVLCRVREVCI